MALMPYEILWHEKSFNWVCKVRICRFCVYQRLSMSSEKSNSVWGIVAKAALGPVVAAIVAAVSPPFLAFLKMLWSHVVGGWLWLGEEHMVSGWLITLMSVGTAGVLIVLALALREHLKENSLSAAPWWKSFREMSFRGATWRWSWSSAGDIVDLIPYCPTCEGYLLPREPEHDLLYGSRGDEVQLCCENCNLRVVSTVRAINYYQTKGVIKREILRQIRIKDLAK